MDVLTQNQPTAPDSEVPGQTQTPIEILAQGTECGNGQNTELPDIWHTIILFSREHPFLLLGGLIGWVAMLLS